MWAHAPAGMPPRPSLGCHTRAASSRSPHFFPRSSLHPRSTRRDVMPDERPRRWLPVPDRPELLAREHELVAATNAVDGEQRALAEQSLALRRELDEIRRLLWRPTPGHKYRKTR